MGEVGYANFSSHANRISIELSMMDLNHCSNFPIRIEHDADA